MPGGITWAQTRDASRTAGGHLVSIDSAEENQAVFELAAIDPGLWVVDGAGNTQGPWLGAHQPAGSTEPRGGWQWTDGRPVSYANWKSGEPNNCGGAENCAGFFNHGKNKGPFWNDAGCEARFKGYIVEFDGDVQSPSVQSER